MDRRDFLKKAALGTGAIAMGTGAGAAETGGRKVRLTTRLDSQQGYVKEPAKEVPVVRTTDVVVVGGGPAGVAAAIAAARRGSSVLLIERYNHLGGLWTGGEVLPVLCTHGVGKAGDWSKAVLGISDEICGRLFDMGMAIDRLNPTVDPEACKYVLDRMVVEAGAEVMFFSQAAGVVMSGERIDALLLETKSGRVAVKCKLIVDSSGDGDVFDWAGQPFRQMPYHIGLMSRIGNADKVDTEAPGFERQNIGSRTPIPGVTMLHMAGERDQDGLDVLNLSRLQLKYRKEIWEKVEAIKKKPGYKDIFLLDTASQLGVRVTRVLDALHTVTLDESMEGTVYDDVIGMSGASDPVTYKGRKVVARERPVWQIPYRALLPRKCPNLIVAGRCIGFDDGLAWDAREIGTCLVTGQAAGTAAAMAVQTRTDAREVDIRRLQDNLRRSGVRLDF